MISWSLVRIQPNLNIKSPPKEHDSPHRSVQRIAKLTNPRFKGNEAMGFTTSMGSSRVMREAAGSAFQEGGLPASVAYGQRGGAIIDGVVWHVGGR